MKKSCNESAFPVIESESDSILGFESDQYSHFVSGVKSVGGLTKRELFAAMAMQGLLACTETAGCYETFAHNAVKMADALIEELNRESSEGER